MYRNRNEKWIGTNQAYSDASTLIRMRATGYNTGNIVAKITVTWYCKFRGPAF